jgi:hypothetical protein
MKQSDFTYIGLLSTYTMTPYACKSGFASEEGWDRKDSAVEQDLPQFQFNPIPKEQTFKSTKGSYKGKNGRREEA